MFLQSDRNFNVTKSLTEVMQGCLDDECPSIVNLVLSYLEEKA